jgi:radical SAM superfamily enzyme YgiQ (UPF0313 family)
MLKKALLVYPEFPETFWSFKGSLGFAGKKANFPPLSLLTVAALLPGRYIPKIVDMNVGPLEQADLDWADIVFTSAMLVQKESLARLVDRVKRAGKTIVAGGPFPTQCREQIAGVDHFVLGEAEITLSSFIEDFEEGRAKRVYESGEKPDLALTPRPRYDLIDFKPYSSMMLQYSRGCPNDCEFCDIIELYGRKPRVKSPDQFVGEIESLYRLGYRGGIFIVDDNFIGNRVAVKEVLRRIIAWQAAHGRPFTFSTEASVDLAKDDELLGLMTRAGFTMAFVGIETPVAESLESAHKRTNLGISLRDSVRKIQESGIEVTAGFIVGFDTDPEDVAARQIAFIQESGIATAMVGLLSALPGTALFRRLAAEGRLLGESSGDNTHELRLNFVPRMDASRLIDAYAEVLTAIYDPKRYFERCDVLLGRLPRRSNAGAAVVAERSAIENARAFILSFARQAFSRYGRRYLRFLANTLLRRPWALAKAIEKAIHGYSLIEITRMKVRRPWVRAKSLGRELELSIGRLQGLMDRKVPAGLEAALAGAAAIRRGLRSIAAAGSAYPPVPALSESPVRAFAERAAAFLGDLAERLPALAANATERQRRRIASAVSRYRRRCEAAYARARPAGSVLESLFSQIAALDSIISFQGAPIRQPIESG